MADAAWHAKEAELLLHLAADPARMTGERRQLAARANAHATLSLALLVREIAPVEDEREGA